MPIFSSPIDSTQLYYRYYVPDNIAYKPQSMTTQSLSVVFLHGWPMSSRMYDQYFATLCETYRFPCLAPDRRGFGNSDWSSATTHKIGGVTFDVLTADLIGLLEHLTIGDFIFVAASMGASESILAYQSSDLVKQHCKGFVWIGPNMPYTIKCPESPNAPTEEVWDYLIGGFRSSASKSFTAEQIPSIFRVDLGNEVGARALQFFERVVVQADPVALEKTAIIFRKPMAKELEELGKDNDVPILILHGDSDSGMPLEVSARFVQQMVPRSELKVYKNAGHGRRAPTEIA
jgi:non-heme chloroperoxidase